MTELDDRDREPRADRRRLRDPTPRSRSATSSTAPRLSVFEVAAAGRPPALLARSPRGRCAPATCALPRGDAARAAGGHGRRRARHHGQGAVRHAAGRRRRLPGYVAAAARRPAARRADVIAGIDDFLDGAVGLLERAARFAMPAEHVASPARLGAATATAARSRRLRAAGRSAWTTRSPTSARRWSPTTGCRGRRRTPTASRRCSAPRASSSTALSPLPATPALRARRLDDPAARIRGQAQASSTTSPTGAEPRSPACRRRQGAAAAVGLRRRAVPVRRAEDRSSPSPRARRRGRGAARRGQAPRRRRPDGAGRPAAAAGAPSRWPRSGTPPRRCSARTFGSCPSSRSTAAQGGEWRRRSRRGTGGELFALPARPDRDRLPGRRVAVRRRARARASCATWSRRA